MASLFQPGDVSDPAYRNLRDSEECAGYKAFCESLWARFEPFADRHFLRQIQIQFHPRFWEMYLTVTFLERGFRLHKLKGGGPEFGIDIEGRRYWFDAIAPTGGAGADAVPEPDFGGSEARLVPNDKIVLRYTAALWEKRKKWQADLERGRVTKSDGFVVAINDRSIPRAWLTSDLPRIVKGFYGQGDLAIAFNKETKKIVGSMRLHKPTVKKEGGELISAQAFAAHECPEVSAVLYSSADAVNYPGALGADFLILHNDEPNVPLPRGALRFRSEYAVEGGRLREEDWVERGDR